MPDFVTWWLDHWPLIPVLILFLPGLFNDFRQLWLDWSWYHAGYYFNRQESRFTERRVVCRKCGKRPGAGHGVSTTGGTSAALSPFQTLPPSWRASGDPVIGFDGPTGGKP